MMMEEDKKGKAGCGTFNSLAMFTLLQITGLKLIQDCTLSELLLQWRR